MLLKKYKGKDFDSPEMSRTAKNNLQNKRCLHDNYVDTYREMIKLANKFLIKDSRVKLELGSGGGFFKEICEDVITSDVTDVNGVDMVIDAQSLPFEDESIDIIYAVHVLHHIPDVNKFLSEVVRVCKVSGGCVLVEPYWSVVGKFFYKHLHPENYNEKVKEWSFESTGAMSGANQALSYLILKRDRKIFNEKYPELNVEYDRPFNGLRYIATGGIWLKPYLPEFIFPILTWIEKKFWPLMYIFGIHHIFVIKKVK